MKIEIPNKVLGALVIGGACFAAGLGVAAEFPSDDSSLTYSGRLTDNAGNALTTPQSISVTLFDAASGGTSLCVGSSAAVDLGASQGHFSVQLPALCSDAIAEAGDAWAEVKVGSTTLPRQKLGAVPFALVAREAQSAESADAVAPGGVTRAAVAAGAIDTSKLDPTLASSITAHETRLDAVDAAVSVAGGLLSQPTQPAVGWNFSVSALTGTPTDMPIHNVMFVQAASVDTTGKRFIVEHAGIYLVSGQWAITASGTGCTIYLQVAVNEVAPITSSVERVDTGSYIIGDGFANLMKLEVGDAVKIKAYAVNCTSAPLTAQIGIARLY